MRLVGSLFKEFWANIFMVIFFCQMLAYWSYSVTDEFPFVSIEVKHSCIWIYLGVAHLHWFITSLFTCKLRTYSFCTLVNLLCTQSIWFCSLCLIACNIGALVTIHTYIWTVPKLVRKICVFLVSVLDLINYVSWPFSQAP